MDSTNSEIDFSCPHCGQQYSVDPSMIGHSTRCQTCGKIMMISVPGRPKSAPRPTSSQLNGTTASSSGKKGFSQRDFALGVITTVAVFIVGIWMYQKGIVKITPTKTANHREPTTRAAQPPKPKNDPGFALYKEAMRYYNGDDVLQDYTKAVELLKQASEKGSAEADGQLSAIYWDGDANQQQDKSKAIFYAKKAGRKKTQMAHQVLGLCYLFGAENIQQQNFELAYSELSNATDYYYCGFLVGLMRYHGVGTKTDKKGAAEMFFSLCKTKNRQETIGMAALCLGYMYVQGEGVGKNVPEGVSWMKWGIKASKRDFLKWDGTGYPPTYELYETTLTFTRKYGTCDISFPDKWPGPDGSGGMTLLAKAIKLYFDEQLFR